MLFRSLIYVSTHKIKKVLFILLFIILIQLLFWFINSPLVRFGFNYVLLFIFFITAFLLNKFFLKEINIKFIYILIFLALFFNLQKNIYRIKNDIINNYTFFYTYPSTTYDREILDQDRIHLNYLGKNSLYCWDVPAICSYERSLRSEVINNYIFIK